MASSSFIRFNCVSKTSSLWRLQRPTISAPASCATTRCVTRPLSTRPKHDSPPQQDISQSDQCQIHPTTRRTQPKTPSPTHNLPTSTSTSKSKSTTRHLLARQRLNRPVAPHLSIYRRQITSVLSVFQRLTGLTLSAAFTLFPILYLSSTHLGLGLGLSAEALATFFGSLPWIIKSAVKFGVAWIFTFHGSNSLRFLAWKFAIGVTNKEVAVTGWWVVVGSVAGAVGLAWYV